MPPSSTHTGSPSLPHPPSPASDPCVPGSDNPEDQVDAGVWKRRYHVLQESVNAQTASKRKAE
jgi:hypothetical protein